MTEAHGNERHVSSRSRILFQCSHRWRDYSYFTRSILHFYEPIDRFVRILNEMFSFFLLHFRDSPTPNLISFSQYSWFQPPQPFCESSDYHSYRRSPYKIFKSSDIPTYKPTFPPKPERKFEIRAHWPSHPLRTGFQEGFQISGNDQKTKLKSSAR